jgi:S1-C subfamily serine protease
MSTFDEERPRPHRSGSPWLPLLIFLVLLLLVPIAGLAIWRLMPYRSGGGLDPNAQPRLVAARGELAPAEKANIEIYDEAAPGVVHVTNMRVSGSPFSLNAQEVPRGTGSGFIWDDEGHIVTNYHVIEGADSAQVIMSDHSSYSARQVWAYPDEDMAVLRIDAPKNKLHPLLIGTSHDLKVGQLTYAIGNPFGLDHTMTTGIVSALGREIEAANNHTIRGVIQTSAAINPGNSGGPLLDSAGRLIGMNTAILSPSGTFAGIGFAIPVDEINRVVPQLISHGKVVRPRLGVQLADDQIAQRLGIDKGALILKVAPDSAASEAGLHGTRRDDNGHIQLGDVIVAINGKTVDKPNDVYHALNDLHPGDTATITVVRDEKRQDIQVKLRAAE